MKTRTGKRIFTLLLALVMVLGLFPASTFADDGAAEPARIAQTDPVAYAPEGGDDLAEPSDDVGPWFDSDGKQYYKDFRDKNYSDGRIYYVADDASPFVVEFRNTVVSLPNGEEAFASYEKEGVDVRLRVYPIDGEEVGDLVYNIQSQCKTGVVDPLAMDIFVADENGDSCPPDGKVSFPSSTMHTGRTVGFGTLSPIPKRGAPP